jgi:hypothetical protein
LGAVLLILGALLYSIGYAKARARRTRNHIK